MRGEAMVVREHVDGRHRRAARCPGRGCLLGACLLRRAGKVHHDASQACIVAHKHGPRVQIRRDQLHLLEQFDALLLELFVQLAPDRLELLKRPSHAAVAARPRVVRQEGLDLVGEILRDLPHHLP